jgi:hypothetical protein
MEMLHAGVFNAWTEKSLSKLAELMPGRYAKAEVSSGIIVAIDHYAYRSPLAQAASQTASNASTPGKPDPTTQTTPGNGGTTPGNPEQTTQPAPTPSKLDPTARPAPIAANDGVAKHANPQ